VACVRVCVRDSIKDAARLRVKVGGGSGVGLPRAGVALV
jgi:hypothetical protein